MGNYQKIQPKGSNYLAIFDRGSVLVTVKFKDNGSIESLIFGCPISKSLSINDAPEDLRKALLKRAGFKS